MWRVLKKTVEEFTEDNCMRMAAALSYYTVFSLPPLLVVVISSVGLTGLVSEEAAHGRLRDEIRSVVGEAGAQQVQTMIRHVNRGDNSFWGTIIGVVVLLFGATGVMVQLQEALNEAWDIKPEERIAGVLGFFVKRLLSLGMILAFAFLILVSLLASTVIRAMGDQLDVMLAGSGGHNYLAAMNWVLTLGTVTAMFAVMYRFLPDRDVTWRQVWLGACVTGVLFMVAKWALGIYLSHSDVASTYGAAGALALILIWIYYSAIIFLLGAEFTQVWARRHGSEEFETSKDSNE
ncbi:MAG: YihY/virulence factor BrkB family protein [Planctomycetaceae bacterium]|nr:YihY/virulence factor BrkB family protein [Planctomycetaceae bacterium]